MKENINVALVCVCGGGAQIVEIDSDKLRSQGTKLWKHILRIKENE